MGYYIHFVGVGVVALHGPDHLQFIGGAAPSDPGWAADYSWLQEAAEQVQHVICVLDSESILISRAGVTRKARHNVILAHAFHAGLTSVMVYLLEAADPFIVRGL